MTRTVLYTKYIPKGKAFVMTLYDFLHIARYTKVTLFVKRYGKLEEVKPKNDSLDMKAVEWLSCLNDSMLCKIVFRVMPTAYNYITVYIV